MRINYISIKITVISLLFIVTYYPQHHIIMTYNLLNYPGNDSSIRNQYFQTAISSINPDIIVAQEVLSQQGVDEFLNTVLINISSDYTAGEFINGNDTDNAIFFKSAFFTFVSNIPIQTALRDINEFTLAHINGRDTIKIYSLHLKASQGSDNELKRAAEVDSLRKITDALPPGTNFIVVGDYNIYYSGEPAYQKLLDQTNSGYVLDPINTPGSWHNDPSFASIHTQSPRTRQFGGGANGGMDDRFDMILISQTISDGGYVSYLSDSYTAYGNDGNHFNDSINSPPNTVVSQEIANAIHYASDHIPLFASFIFYEPLAVEPEMAPDEFLLYQNYPNPFNGTSTLIYQLPSKAFVDLRLYDFLGRSVEVLVNEEQGPGNFTVEINSDNLASGIYFVRIIAGNLSKAIRMIVLK